MVKRCAICKQMKEIEDFYKNRSNKNGITPRCRICHRLRQNQYRANNLAKVKAYQRVQYNTSLQWRYSSYLGALLRGHIRNIKRNLNTPNSKMFKYKILQKHLESLFKPGMTWQNYGIVWELDHIRPLCSFDLTDPEQRKEANELLNLQPLFIEDNYRKGQSIPDEVLKLSPTVIS